MDDGGVVESVEDWIEARTNNCTPMKSNGELAISVSVIAEVRSWDVGEAADGRRFEGDGNVLQDLNLPGLRFDLSVLQKNHLDQFLVASEAQHSRPQDGLEVGVCLSRWLW